MGSFGNRRGSSPASFRQFHPSDARGLEQCIQSGRLDSRKLSSLTYHFSQDPSEGCHVIPQNLAKVASNNSTRILESHQFTRPRTQGIDITIS